MTNCPSTYKNIGCESFRDGKKITAQILRQFCKNDAYLYEQIMELWDMTDPESKKRFYPPFFMDNGKSFGIEPCYTKVADGRLYDDNDIITKKVLEQLQEQNGEEQSVFYHLSNCNQEVYRFNYDKLDDKTYRGQGSQKNTLYIDSDYLIEDDSTLHIVTEHNSTTDQITHKLLPYSLTDTIDVEVPYTVKGTKIVKTKEDVYSKKSNLDAKCDGAYHNFKCNSVWYIGYNRHKNYNIKNEWRKNSDTTDIPSVCRCQTFKAKNSGLLTKVGFMMRGSKSSASPLIVEIRTTDKKTGKPTQKVLARAEQKFNHSTTTMVNITFEKGCIINKNQKYAIVLRSPLSQFNHCYWIGGWASSCFSNSRKRAYYDGETYLSEDNGKTWVVHGKREKCYGSHYYDWGFAEPPVNFAFEVYVAPKTGTVTKETVTGSDSTKYYKNSFTYDYYPKGEYYLNFKAFTGGRYNRMTLDGSLPSNTTNIEWSWELFDENDQTWKSLSNYPHDDGGNNSIFWNSPVNFIKPRIKLKLNKNIYADPSVSKTAFENIVKQVKEKKLDNTANTNFTNWKNDITSKMSFAESITQPSGIIITLGKHEAPYGYLRTLTYHPEQDTMLPACIWSEVDAKIVENNNVNVKIDIVHEDEKIERIILAKTNNYDLLKPYLEEMIGDDIVNERVTDDASMNSYIVDNSNKLTKKGGEFYEYLKKQSPPVYFLPNGTVNYLDGVNKDCLPLEDYPAYPMNNVTLNGSDDIQLSLTDLTAVSSTSVKYTLPRSMNISRISLRYVTIVDGEWEYIETDLVNSTMNSKAYDYSINNNVITFNIGTEYKDSSNNTIDNCLLSKFISEGNSSSYSVVSDSDTLKPSLATISIECVDKNLNEFENYLIDYDNKLMKLYNPSSLFEGDLKINYNPVWCKNLEVDDFPLKLDLWTETFEIRNESDGYYIDKVYNKYNKETKDYSKEVIKSSKPNIITLSTLPRDSIRKVSIDDGTNEVVQLEEDDDFKVDYINKIIKVNTKVYDEDSDGKIITVKYTPNLTDNGLALVYKLYRSDFVNGIKGVDPSTTDTFELLYGTEYTVKSEDDVFVGMNSWTYRT